MAHIMYSQHHLANQKPETFMLSTEAQQSLPQDAQVALQQVDNLKYFLISAPVDWAPDQYIRRFLLPTGEYVSCVLWNNLFHISGTDIVRCLSFRFQAFGRPVKNSKKFEEGIFSDLRNLKSGTDASLEEPKSPFLDFLYKNNCIRTQKKQKVFYWYSVPHDRLFLDALERDLKREKMGQEATTVAVSEPALSFEFDSSQSLFEQLTKAQQANSSSFSAHASYSSSTSPVMRAMDSMPPPQIIPHSMPIVHEDMGQMGSYPQIPMSLPAPVKREDEFSVGPYFPSDRTGMPLSRPMHQRTVSMPSYLEYSPAPSFAPSEDYSARGISYEPVTPPQQMVQLSEPHYLAHDGSVYNTMPDHTGANALHGMIQLPLPPVSGAPAFNSTPRAYSNNVYSVIEGSPTYKQRRRRSSITPSNSALAHATNAATGHTRRASDHLRRSATASVIPMSDHGSDPDSPPVNMGMQMPPREIVDLSRHGTPLSYVEDHSPAPHSSMMQQQHEDSSLPPTSNCDQSEYGPGSDIKRPGAIRRAKSATIMEVGPYPQKSHSCPIPSCGRLFKRLEHLKRHVRTHTQERPYICNHCNKAFSRSDNLAQHRRTHDRDGTSGNAENYSGSYSEEDLENEEDQLQTIEDVSETSEHSNYIPQQMPMTGMPPSMPAPSTLMHTALMQQMG
ncbi:STE-domain-containing protein [Tuber magnatum]|uniref:STE-domain-containing protein n=1 Tax=Tuber magnatum TaxID=42249 RepID=A0A317SUN5_9PEZI|nr:STE-domain-containing protein [Tuber magnatum]